MRRNGVHSLSVDCLKCHHEATINVDDQPGYLAVPSFHRRFRCSQCGSKETQVMPHGIRGREQSRTLVRRSHLAG
jgi:hypothetical protein